MPSLTANNGVLGHGLEVLADKDISAASGGDKDLTDGGGLLHGGDLVARDGSLEGVDGVDLGDENASTHGVEGLGATLADITETSDNGNLTGNHDISGSLDTIDERLSAAVKVVELALGDGVVDVDGGDEKTVVGVLEHSVEVVDTGGGLLGDTVAVLKHLGVLLVDESGKVTTVIGDEVKRLAGGERGELLLKAPLVLLLGLALPGEDWGTAGGNGSGGVILGGEDVAAGPGEFGTKSLEGLDEDSSLDGWRTRLASYECSQCLSKLQRTHVQASSNASAGEGLLSCVLFANGHQTGHLMLGEVDLPAAKGGEREVCDLEFLCWGRHCDCD